MIEAVAHTSREPTPPCVSVVVVHWNTPDLLERCLASVPAAMAGERHEVIVVDNGSRGTGRPSFERAPGLRVILNPCNRGFAVAANQGARAARGEYLLFVNSDVELSGGSVAQLLAELRGDPRLGAVAPATVDAHGGLAFPAMRLLGPLNHALGLTGLTAARSLRVRADRAGDDRLVVVPWTRASTLLVSRRVFHALAGFDEGFFFYEEDEDFCWRLARGGYRVAVDRDVVVGHHGGASARVARNWPVRALYAGHLRFVRRRGGPVAALIYRLGVSSVLLAKLGLCLTLPPLARRSRHVDHRRIPELLRLLWRGRGVPGPSTAAGVCA
jgi:N-acetylglucosaminyl-diphospho-decaprenol L-rhamnosyltransferase